MKILLQFIFLIQLTLTVHSQTITINGIVKDNKTGEPLIGANVICTETQKAVGTDVHGMFKLSVPFTNEIQLTASYVGFRSTSVKLNPNDIKLINIFLESGIEINEVNISATRPIEETYEMGTIEIPVNKLKTLPMLGEHDILKIIQLMPGVQAGSDGRNGLYVRGGSADQNQMMLDGAAVYYVNHLGGFVSVFHPDILKNVKLYKSDFPARFGGRLSSVIDLRMKEGNKKEHHGSWGVGLISGDICFEGPIKKDKTSYIIAARRVWIDLLMRPSSRIAFKDFDMGYHFYDLFGKISHEQDAKNRYYLSFFGSNDLYGFNFNIKEDDNKGHTRYSWGNLLATTRWNHIYNSQLSSDISLFYTRYRYKIDQTNKTTDSKTENGYYTGVHDFGLKADFSFSINNYFLIKYGAGTSANWFIPGETRFKETIGNMKTDTIIGKQNQLKAMNFHVYIENDIQLTKWLKANIGARMVNYHVNQKNYFSFEPRLMAMAHRNNLGAFSFSYSKMTQPVHMLSYSGTFFPTDIWLPSSPSVSPSTSVQYAGGYSKTLLKGLFELSIEAYFKNSRYLIEPKAGSVLINTAFWEKIVETNGYGKAEGIEFMLKKNQGRTSGWVSYTLSKSDRQFENLNQGRSFPFKYDRRHDISLVISHQLTKKIDLSATWIFGTGYPTNTHNGKYQTFDNNSSYFDQPTQEYFSFEGEAFLYPGKNWLKLSPYHRLDLGINFNKQKGKKLRTWTIGIYNAYAHNNAVAYFYEDQFEKGKRTIHLYQQNGFPLVPTVKYSVKF
jgi:hypothetical protein